MSKNNVIGHDGALPWHLSADLKRFKRITMGHPIIMGRSTYDSIGKPLPGRTNIVLTRRLNWHPAGIEVVQSKSQAIDVAINSAGNDEIFIIGGGQIYREFIDDCEQFYLTLVDRFVAGSTTFPDTDWAKDFHLLNKEAGSENELNYEFLDYQRLSRS